LSSFFKFLAQEVSFAIHAASLGRKAPGPATQLKLGVNERAAQRSAVGTGSVGFNPWASVKSVPLPEGKASGNRKVFLPAIRVTTVMKA
jgi:hypothetical protein